VLYTGRVLDLATGLYYYRRRLYDAVLGSFIQRDPVLYVFGELNLYRYVFNSPLNAIDPSGLACCCCCVENLAIANVIRLPQDVPGVKIPPGHPGWLQGGIFGHIFDVKISLRYIENGSGNSGDCQLLWEEKINIPAYKNVKANEWTDMYKLQHNDPSIGMFQAWDKRSKTCPGTNAEDTILTDGPQHAIILGARKLQFRITVKSAPGCPCEMADFLVATAVQELDANLNIPKITVQTFTTPDPAQTIPGPFQ
jgi:RHS repeat-associated protein